MDNLAVFDAKDIQEKCRFKLGDYYRQLDSLPDMDDHKGPPRDFMNQKIEKGAA